MRKQYASVGAVSNSRALYKRWQIGATRRMVLFVFSEWSVMVAERERKSTAHTQTILRTWGAFSRPPMPIYAVGIAQVPSVNTPTRRRLLRMDAGLSSANSPQPMRIRKLLRDI